MGCAGSKSIAIIEEQFHLFLNCSINIYINEKKIKLLLENSNKENIEYQKYYLINKYWLDDCKKFFCYKEIEQFLDKEKNNDYKIYENNKDYKMYERDVREKILENKEIKEKIENKIKRNFIIPRVIQAENLIENKIILLNKGEGMILNVNTSLIDSQFFKEIIKNMKLFDRNFYINFEKSLNKYDVIINNNELYIKSLNNPQINKRFKVKKSEVNNDTKLSENNINSNLINDSKVFNNNENINEILFICKLEEATLNLRTKYFISFEKGVNTDDIIKNEIIGKNIKNLIEKKIINNKEIVMKNLILDNKKIGIIFNFIIAQEIEEENLLFKEKNNEIINDINSSFYPEEKNKINNLINSSHSSRNNIIQINNDKDIIKNDNYSNNDINQKELLIRRFKKLSYNSFINEFVQCLANIEKFKDFLLDNEKEIDKNKNFSGLSLRFINTIRFIFNIEYNNNKLINDEYFENNYNYPKDNIVLFIEFLFNKLKEELKDLYMNNIIEKYFYGKEGIICECTNCNYPVNKVNQFCYLKFNVDNVFNFFKNKNNNLKSISVKDCFNYNKYKYDDFICQKCGKKEYKKYSYNIMNVPEIIMVILENLNNNNLIINSFLSSNSLIHESNNIKEVYTLINKININENNEYTTYLRFYENLNWYECKENEIIECNKEKIEKGNPYILMYQKVDDISNNKYVDELDRSIEIDNDEKLDLIVYSTVSQIKERLDNLDYNMKFGELYNILCKKYNFQNYKIFFFNNSRKLEPKKTIKENNLSNNDFVIMVEFIC